MLSDPGAAREVALGSQGALEGLSRGKGYIDASTVDGGTSCTIGEAVRGAGASFLEAPVSGSKGPAEQGTLIFMTAGVLGDLEVSQGVWLTQSLPASALLGSFSCLLWWRA